MDQYSFLRNRLSQINENNFDEIALEVFKLQAKENQVYARFLSLYGVNLDRIKAIQDIPFLPIGFFKSHEVKTGNWKTQKIFRSSGTTATGFSCHHVRELSFYLEYAAQSYEYRFGPLQGTHFFAVLPSYSERDDSSLVAMAAYFIEKTESPFSGFYLGETDRLRLALNAALATGRPVVILGVTFALLDLAQSGFDFSGVRLMETGGMKGRRKEMIRQELYAALQTSNPAELASEYGMTELYSQAYAGADSIYQCSRLMKVLIREINDPLSPSPHGSTGLIHVVDLANLDTCSFIATQDLGRFVGQGFQVLGRADYSDVRGCSLMAGQGGLDF